MKPIRVFIGQSGTISRVTCERLLRDEADISLVGHADNPMEILAAVARYRPDVLIMGVEESSPHTIELVSTIRRLWPSTRTLLLPPRDSTEDWMVNLILCGARGLLTSDALDGQLVKALRVVSGGQVWISRRLAGSFVDRVLH